MTPEGKLSKAVKQDDLSSAAEAIRLGANINHARISGLPLFRFAAQNGQRSICELLQAAGADVDAVDGARRYALLHHAAASKNYGMASILLDLKANPTPKASNSATPLHVAARTGQGYLATLLLKHHADVNAQDSLGRTPLHWAVEKADQEMVKLLLKHGCQADLVDRKHRSPFSIANNNGEVVIAELLSKAGGTLDSSHTQRVNKVAESDGRNPFN